MKLDKTFAREISKISNGDGSREARLEFLKSVKEVKRTLSCLQAPELFDGCIKQYGRVPVAICTALTIWDRHNWLRLETVCWALDVLELWDYNPHDKSGFLIDDGLHPAAIQRYASPFIRLTILEDE